MRYRGLMISISIKNHIPCGPNSARSYRISSIGTAYLGGHLERCTHCGIERIQYHSCRNRHCPKCQHMPRQQWLQARKAEILPTTYFHVVFTLPHGLNPIILDNKDIMLNLLFKAVSQTLLRRGPNP